MARRSVLYINPSTGRPVYADTVVREEKAAGRTQKRRARELKKYRRVVQRTPAGETPPSPPRYSTAPKVRRTPQPKAAPRRRPPPSQGSSSLDEAFGKLGVASGSKRTGRNALGLETAGFDPTLLRGRDGGRSIGGFLSNLGRGGVDILVSIPASAQLGAEAALGAGAAAYNLARGDLFNRPGGGGDDLARRVQTKTGQDLQAAARGVRADYAHRYGPLVRGDLGEFGARFYDDPTPTLLDVLGAKAVVGRAPNVAARAVRVVAPESRAGLAAGRALSTLSAEDRAAYAAATGQRIKPGPGGRYRPPREVRSRVARDEEGKPNVGERVIEVPRPAYSGDAIARARQKGVDRLRRTVGVRIERAAEARQRAALPVGSRQAGLRERAVARAVRPLTSQARFDRFQRRNALDLRDLHDAQAEVLKARTMPGAARAIAKLKQDKDVVGRRLPGLSVEEAAFALHRMDMLGDVVDGARGRGGLTASQLRDRYVRTIEGGQRAARASGKRTENAAAQLAAIKAVPDELLELTDMANPAVRRVAAAVDESRRLGRISQAQAVRSGIITNATRREAGSRDSAIGVGGQRWAADAIRKVTTTARRRTLGIKKRIAKAEAAGDATEVRRLQRVLADHVKATRGRVAAIRLDATRVTPELREARAAAAEMDRRLAEEAATGTAKDVQAATRSRDRYFKRVRKLEREALGFTSPRRPELVGRRGVYVPDRRVDVTEGYTGPRRGGRLSGPDRARRSAGRLKARGGMDLNPNLVLHQAARSADNYTGRISAKALDELLQTAAYHDPRTGRPLTGDRLRLLSAADSERVRLVHVGNLRKALRALDELPEGKFLDDTTIRSVFTDEIPANARASDYVAISKDAADVWTETMRTIPVIDKALNYWKGGLLALSPRWYVNNTFGLALQYAVMTGGDVKAIFKANRSREIRRAMEARSPNAVKDTLAADLTGGDVPAAIRFGFQINSKLEEVWRRAAYLNRAKRAIRDEGGRFRSMTDGEIADAITRMPEAKVADIIRDMDFFIGNYRKFNKVEREFLKRVIPFYSWMRVIARLTFGLPFRSPVRAAAMALLETASTAGINPNDKALPYYARGAIRVGDKAVPTWGLNPWQTLAGTVVAAGEPSPSGALAQEALGFMRPEAQFAVERATGINSFGRGVITPPGTAPFGQDPKNYNQVGAGISRQSPRISLLESALQTVFPGQVSVIRKVAAGGRQPYDQSTTPDLAMDALGRLFGGERNEKLYAKKSNKPRGRRPSGVSAYTAAFGIPIYEQDDRTLTREAREALNELRDEIRKRERAGR